jgi:hypothetical protein
MGGCSWVPRLAGETGRHAGPQAACRVEFTRPVGLAGRMGSVGAGREDVVVGELPGFSGPNALTYSYRGAATV